MSVAITGFVRRPDLGKSGKPIKINANFFEVTRLPNQNIYHYDVTILPDVPQVVNRRVFQQFEDMNRDTVLNGIRPVYDGRKNIFTPRPLPFGESATFNVTLPEDDGSTSTKSPRSFQLLIKIANEVVMEELHSFMRKEQTLTENCLTGIMVIDVLIRHRPSMLYTTVGRSFYTPNGSRQLPNGAEVWQGYYQSARPSENRMLINVDVSATAFYEAGPLIDVVAKILNRRSVDELRRGINDRDRVKVEKTIKGLKIRVRHRGEVKRKYKISKLTLESADKTFFGNENEAKQDVASYFQRTYNRRLDFVGLPCVVVSKDTYLPMEVCEIIPGQRHNKKLNERQTAEMIKFTCQPPQERANKIMNGIAMLDYDENQYLRQFGLTVKREMVVVNARVLDTPKLSYNAQSQEPSFFPQGGVWNLRGKKVATGATLGSWSVVAFGNERDFPPQQINGFIRELVTTFQDTGMNILNRNPPVMHANPQGDIDQALKTAWLRAGNAAKAQPQLVVCILPNTGVHLYAQIKRVSDTVIGIATQCIQGKHTQQPKKTVLR